MSSFESFTYLVNHIFLPPKLPQKKDSSFTPVLLDVVTKALEAFQEHLTGTLRENVGVAIDMIRNVKAVHDSETEDLMAWELHQTLSKLLVQGMSHLELFRILQLMKIRRLSSTSNPGSKCWHSC